jgi:hypothetical protein
MPKRIASCADGTWDDSAVNTAPSGSRPARTLSYGFPHDLPHSRMLRRRSTPVIRPGPPTRDGPGITRTRLAPRAGDLRMTESTREIASLKPRAARTDRQPPVHKFPVLESMS